MRKFTTKQAKRLCDNLEAQGWSIFEDSKKVRCASCARTQQVDWDYCPHCGLDHSQVPPEVDDHEAEETIEMVRELVEEAINDA